MKDTYKHYECPCESCSHCSQLTFEERSKCENCKGRVLIRACLNHANTNKWLDSEDLERARRYMNKTRRVA